jgi:phage tail-like protein
MATGVRNDPYRGFNFRIEIDNVSLASFSEVSGLVADGDSVDYREGDEPVNWVRKLIGLRKFGVITFKRGYTQNKELWSWHVNIVNGTDDRRNGAIVLSDEARTDVLRWNFRNGWVNKIEGPNLNATSNTVAMESMELCHEGLELEI